MDQTVISPDKGDKFRQELDQFLKVFEPYAKRYFDKRVGEAAKYPILISQLYRDLYDFGVGGKKMRAFLVYLGYAIGKFTRGPVASFPPAFAKALAGRPASKSSAALPLEAKQSGVGSPSSGTTPSKQFRDILPICLAIEIIHNFLLIHDDIIDKSQTRRGKPTIHKRYEKDYGEHYGISQAIFVGDIACFEALKLINSSVYDDKKKTQLVSEIINILRETAYGEVLDVEYSYRKAKIGDIWQVVDLKTARYSFVGPLKIGAMLGNANKSQLGALFKFGIAAGKAFQLQDDILGVFGNEKVTGKSAITDLQEGKNTILIYKARELAKGKNKSDLEKIWGKKDAKMADLEMVRAIIKDSGALEWSSREALRLVSEAKQYIAGITSDADLRQVFYEIAEFVIRRQS